jgi:TP901 family phage tail tape measure protein
MNVAHLKAVVSANTAGFNKGMKDVGRGVSLAGGKIGRFGQAASASFAAIGVAATVAGAAIAANFIKKATTLFIEFEDSLIRTQAIMGKSAQADFPRLEERIRFLGKTTRSTAREVATAAQTLALAGLTVDEMVDDKALDNLNALAIAAGTDMETAAGIAISSLKAYRLETEQLGDVSDVLVNTFTQSFTTLETLGETMKLLGPTAAAAGISLQESAAAAGALGNAGLQGTLAGTGLRMAITKLLKPTDDARKIMEDLGLTMFTLTPAGMEAKSALTDLNNAMVGSRSEVDRTTLALKQLTDEMSDMSIEQQRNNLAIMKIRRRAEKEGRELTSSELEQIERIESANADLALTMEERRLDQSMMRRENEKANDTLSAQTDAFSELNKEVQMQTTGITSLSDLFNQLSQAGATTAQILEVFGVRGGSAVNAILAQKSAFDALVVSNQNAQGRTEEFSDVLRGSTKNSLLELNSAFEDFMIDVGEPFARMLMEDMVPAAKDFIEGLKPMLPQLEELAQKLGDRIVPLFETLEPLIYDGLEAFDLMLPIIELLARVLRGVLTYFRPFLEMFSHFAQAVNDLIEGDFEGFLGHLLQAFLAMFEVMNPLVRAIEAVLDALGMTDAIEGALEDSVGGENHVGNMAKGAAAGAVIGSVVPGVGTVAGGLIGGAIGFGASFFEDGGLITEPTLAMMGENGPEMVVPLGAHKQRQREELGFGGSSAGVTLTIMGGIHIGAGNNINPAQVRQIMEAELPRALSRSSVGSARGVM